MHCHLVRNWQAYGVASVIETGNTLLRFMLEFIVYEFILYAL